MYDLCHRRQKYHGLYSAVIGYVSISEEANIKLVQLVGECMTRKIIVIQERTKLI